MIRWMWFATDCGGVLPVCLPPRMALCRSYPFTGVACSACSLLHSRCRADRRCGRKAENSAL